MKKSRRKVQAARRRSSGSVPSGLRRLKKSSPQSRCAKAHSNLLYRARRTYGQRSHVRRSRYLRVLRTLTCKTRSAKEETAKNHLKHLTTDLISQQIHWGWKSEERKSVYAAAPLYRALHRQLARQSYQNLEKRYRCEAIRRKVACENQLAICGG